jgi:adenosyl cobinamide kinase/adenosyl cobinamide phosphate guanylyltransferase
LAAAPIITLVLGGARSGKSEWAERLAAGLAPPVTYVATAVATAGPDGIESPDPEFAARIEAHRRRRPRSWQTLEMGADLIGGLDALEGSALVDSLGTWVAGSSGFEVDAPGLCAALRARRASTVVVSEEVGLGVHPYTAMGGRFRDALGLVNQAVAEVADEVWLIVAGRGLLLGPPERPGTAGDR